MNTRQSGFLLLCLLLSACGDDDGGGNQTNENQNNNGGPAICGDGVVEGNEACDLGTANSDTIPNRCRTDCTLPTCGDGVTDDAAGYGEQCDDGAANSDTTPNACRQSCLLPSCGDGVIDDAPASAEQCDDGAANSDAPGATCRTNCHLPGCGDGVKDTNEECDQGRFNSDTRPDACRTNCQAARCGDGVTDSDEACDDGNNSGDDGCSADCQSDESCGNGVLDAARGESCDAGEYNAWLPNAPCRPDCTPTRCGDGVVDDLNAEQCDDASANSDTLPGACRQNCQFARCGDGVVDLDETCDDGNTREGDGCGRDCRIEFGWNCTADQPTQCNRCPPYHHGSTCTGCAVLVSGQAVNQTRDGSSWYSALETVQEGIDQAAALEWGCEVWVAGGTYPVWAGSPADTVRLASGVGVYGGFAGNEISIEERDFRANLTVLSGTGQERTYVVYHLVTASDTVDAILDGFVVSGARAQGAGQDRSGSGLYASAADGLVLANCAIFGNTALDHGGGIHLEDSTAQITGCRVNQNTALGQGGGIHAMGSELTITGGVVGNNSATGRGGGIYAAGGELTVAGTVLDTNSSVQEGGGIFATSPSTVTVTDATFLDNSAASGGGLCNAGAATLTNVRLLHNDASGSGGGVANLAGSAGTLTGCIFAGNSAGSGGGLHNDNTSQIAVSGGLFSGNTAGGGGGIGNNRSVIEIVDTIYCGNRAGVGGAETSVESAVSLTSCVVAGNAVDHPHMNAEGGGIYLRDSSPVFDHCTLVGNVADWGGCMSVNYASTPVLHGGILWGNRAAWKPGIGNFGALSECTVQIDYSLYADVECTITGNTGNLTGVSPSFAAEPDDPLWVGTWTAVGFDRGAFQTVFTDNATEMAPGTLAGLFLQPEVGDTGVPDDGDPRWFLILGNDLHSIRVWGDLTDPAFLALSTYNYAIYDLHLAESSLCVDAAEYAAAPETDIEGSPRADGPDADTVPQPDMGAYEYQPGG